MAIDILLLIIGLALVVKGADMLIDGASSIAQRFHVSNLTIGLTVVAFGTSAPELVVNSIASADGHPNLVFGNVIGSNILNLFLVLGISALIRPIVLHSNTAYKEVPISLLAAAVFFVLANDYTREDSHMLSTWDGVVLLLFFILFMYYVYRQLKVEHEQPSVPEKQYTLLKAWGFIVLGLGGLIFGGRLAVDNAVQIASAFGVSEKMIGLTIIAAGTSLPELATSVVASLKNKNDIAVGNIIGSNIFNILLILGVSALIRPLDYDPDFNTDLYILAGGTIFLFLTFFLGKKKQLDRWEAALLLMGYVAYSIFLFGKEM